MFTCSFNKKAPIDINKFLQVLSVKHVVQCVFIILFQCQNLLSMIENNSSSLGMEGGFDTSSKVWLGQEMMVHLELHGLNEPQLKNYEVNPANICGLARSF